MNKRKKIIGILAAAALIVVGVFGAFTYRAVYAQAPTPTPGTGTTNNQPVAPQGQWKGRGGPDGGYSSQDLATALGITTDQLTAANKAAFTEALKEAVSQGLITQAQADQLAANGNDQGRFHGFGMFGAANSIDYDSLLANALGITKEKLQAAYQQAYAASIATAVQNGNLTQAQADEMLGSRALASDSKFQTAMKSAFESAVKQAVTDGVITQAQADAILARQSQAGGVGFPGFGPGFGGGHRGGGFRGGPEGPAGGQNNPTTPAVPAPSTGSSTNG